MNSSLKSFLPGLLFAAALGAGAQEKGRKTGDELFTGPVPRVSVEIPEEGMRVLREYRQVFRQTRPERVDVRATVREGGKVYTNVAVHTKGSWTWQPIDAKPSLTLNFDKFAEGQKFHGLTKVHLNNSVQDPAALNEQFARELFADLGVPAPRATPALVTLNGRELGSCVLIEGANKNFVKRNFASAKGNLYDGGSGGDVTKALETDSGERPEDRSDLTNLVRAAREPDPARRLARLGEVLDVERFITFAAVEASIVHWDGYAIGCNNYRVVNDAARGKLVFMPHGLDQIYGVSASLQQSLTPVFKGMVAKALFAVPEARARYLQRIRELSTNELRVEALHARVDRLAKRMRPAQSKAQSDLLDEAVASLKSRISARALSVAGQLALTKQPAAFPEDGVMKLTAWSYKSGTTRPARAVRVPDMARRPGEEGQLLVVESTGEGSSGSWRTTLFLGEGHYEFTGRARTEGVAATPGTTNGVILRVSGERETTSIVITPEWKALTYAFDVRGLEDVELVCEFRGAQGRGEFDAQSLRLVRKGPARAGTGAVQ